MPLDLEVAAGEPLSLLASPRACPPSLAGARVEHLEFSCRGDRVSCMLVVPQGEGPFPLALLQQDPDGGELLNALARANTWVESGCALASIDLPLQGIRTSPKLTEMLAEAMERAARGNPIDHGQDLLWHEFTRQATIELRRTLDLIAALPTIDAERIGYAGFGLGGLVGAVLCGVDTRPAAVVLAGTGGGVAPAAIAPECFVGAIAPRPLLLVNDAEPVRPGAVSRAAAEKLHAAAGEPKQVVWRADANTALDAAWKFFSEELGL